MKREQAAIGKAKRGKGPRGKRELRRKRLLDQAQHAQRAGRTITQTGNVWPAGVMVRL